MSMQVEACKDIASTLVKVITLAITQSQRITDFDASFTEMNSTELHFIFCKYINTVYQYEAKMNFLVD